MPASDNQSPSHGPSDPFELWRQIYETNERAWNAVLERTVNTPAFAASSGKILETFLSAQKTVRDNMRQYLEQINLPTREDIAGLGELIVALEEKVDQVDDRLAENEGNVNARLAAIERLLDDRLGSFERSVDGRLAGIERSLAAVVNSTVSSPAATPSSGGSASTASARVGTASPGTGGGAATVRKVDGSDRASLPSKTAGGVKRGSGARARTPKNTTS